MARNLYYEDELQQEEFNGYMLKRLLSYAGKYKKTYFLVVVMMVSTSFLSLVPSMINMHIINEVLPQNGVLRDNYMQLAIGYLAGFLALNVGALVANYFSGKMSNILGNSVICDLREDLFNHLTKLSFDFYDNRPTGKILVRVTSYCQEIATFFIDDFVRMMQNVFIMIVAVVCIAIVDWRIALVAIVSSIPLGFILWFMSKLLHDRVQNDRNKNSNRTAFVAEDVSGLQVIKAFNRESLNGEIYDELSEKYYKAFMSTTRVREAFYPVSHGGIRFICYIVIYIGVLFLVDHGMAGALTVGAIAAISNYMSRFSEAIYVVCQRLQKITNVSANIERIFEVLDTEPLIQEKEDAVNLENCKGEVDFSHVDFSYVEGSPILTDVSLHVAPGEMIALIGPTGAGKTTMVSLLARFYEVNGGSISIDGVDIRDISFDSLRRNVGVMMQDTFLFEGTIMENIKYSRPEATDEEAIEAAKTALAHDFIMAKPDGYNTKITSSGTELSGGQRQLISFARLILGRPAIIILDEATSNIDTQTEKQLQSAMNAVLAGRTSFVIAHRLSTIKDANRIIRVENQTIQETTL